MCSFHGVQTFDPTIQKDVLPEHVELYLRVPGNFCSHFAFEAPALPILKFFGRDIDRQRALSQNAGTGPRKTSGSEFHYQREFLKWAVELGEEALLARERLQRDFLSDATETHYQVEALGAHRPGGHSVDGACSFQSCTVRGKPVLRVPILGGKLLPKRKPKVR